MVEEEWQMGEISICNIFAKNIERDVAPQWGPVTSSNLGIVS